MLHGFYFCVSTISFIIKRLPVLIPDTASLFETNEAGKGLGREYTDFYRFCESSVCLMSQSFWERST